MAVASAQAQMATPPHQSQTEMAQYRLPLHNKLLLAAVTVPIEPPGAYADQEEIDAHTSLIKFNRI